VRKNKKKQQYRAALQAVTGVHPVRHLLQSRPQDVVCLYVHQEASHRLRSLIQLADTLGIPVDQITAEELDKRAAGVLHQGVVAERKNPKTETEQDLKSALTAQRNEGLKPGGIYLALDGVQDPHNLGACIRTAEGAGVAGVLFPRDNASQITAVVRKVAAGAAETVPLYRVTNLVRSLQILKQTGYWIIGLEDQAEQTLYRADLSGPLVLVLGGEGSGLRQLTQRACDYLVSIPMQGEVSSLNVSVATGICLFEAIRQRKNG